MSEWTVLSPYAFTVFQPVKAVAMVLRLFFIACCSHGRLGKLLVRDLPIGGFPHLLGMLLINVDFEVAHEGFV